MLWNQKDMIAVQRRFDYFSALDPLRGAEASMDEIRTFDMRSPFPSLRRISRAPRYKWHRLLLSWGGHAMALRAPVS